MILVKCVKVFPYNLHHIELDKIYYGVNFKDGNWSIFLSESYKDFLGIFYNHQFIDIEEYRNNQLEKLKI